MTVEESRDERDLLGRARDASSQARDSVAQGRDARAAARDARATDRELAKRTRDDDAVADRVEAERDRREAATDRAVALADRVAAAADRRVAAGDRLVSSIDGLTGAYRRDSGTLELERETARAHRSGHPFVLAFVDVDGLKETNDASGHSAGDRVLQGVVQAMRANLRSYDLIVRVGGDEFVCGLPDIPMDEAASRFALISADLATAEQATITVGLVELQTGETLQDLIERGDEDLYRQRQRRRQGRVRRPSRGFLLDLQDVPYENIPDAPNHPVDPAPSPEPALPGGLGRRG